MMIAKYALSYYKLIVIYWTCVLTALTTDRQNKSKKDVSQNNQMTKLYTWKNAFKKVFF